MSWHKLEICRVLSAIKSNVHRVLRTIGKFSNTPMKSFTFVRTRQRSLHVCAKSRGNNHSLHRYFSCADHQLQRTENKVENGRITHFGFETISEARKEEKGTLRFCDSLGLS